MLKQCQVVVFRYRKEDGVGGAQIGHTDFSLGSVVVKLHRKNVSRYGRAVLELVGVDHILCCLNNVRIFNVAASHANKVIGIYLDICHISCRRRICCLKGN